MKRSVRESIIWFYKIAKGRTERDRRYSMIELEHFVRGQRHGDVQGESVAREHRKLRKPLGLINYKKLGGGEFQALELGESRGDNDPRQQNLF